MWSKQRELFRAIEAERQVLALTCHGFGKSWTASRAAGWWLDIHPVGSAFVVTSAPSGPQIKAILWKEIGRVHSIGRLNGRVNQTEWYMKFPGGKEEPVAFGRKPSDYNPTAFQGIHARFVLVILDEANGIRGALHEAAGSLISNDYGKILMIGNGDDPSGEFYDASKPGSGWFVVQVGAFDTPNFTGEEIPDSLKHDLIGKIYVEAKRKKWAPNWYWVDEDGERCSIEEGVRVVSPEGVKPEDVNPFWSSKILGQFPIVASDQALIPLSWVKRAQTNTFEPGDPNLMGVDVGAGGDASVGCNRKGRVARILWEDHNPDTMQTCGNVIDFLHKTAAERAQVDVIGIGKGVVDRAKEQDESVVGIGVGEAPDDPKRFVNLRAELYWTMREAFEKNQVDLDPDDEDLAAELSSIRYKRTSHGKIQIESKQEAKNRGVPSPNRAESLMLTFAKPRKKLRRATWGKKH